MASDDCSLLQTASDLMEKTLLKLAALTTSMYALESDLVNCMSRVDPSAYDC
jgi:hypothetical protein